MDSFKPTQKTNKMPMLPCRRLDLQMYIPIPMQTCRRLDFQMYLPIPMLPCRRLDFQMYLPIPMLSCRQLDVQTNQLIQLLPSRRLVQMYRLLIQTPSIHQMMPSVKEKYVIAGDVQKIKISSLRSNMGRLTKGRKERKKAVTLSFQWMTAESSPTIRTFSLSSDVISTLSMFSGKRHASTYSNTCLKVIRLSL